MRHTPGITGPDEAPGAAIEAPGAAITPRVYLPDMEARRVQGRTIQNTNKTRNIELSVTHSAPCSSIRCSALPHAALFVTRAAPGSLNTKFLSIAPRAFTPRASRPRGWPGVRCTPGITAAAEAPGVVITVMPRVGPTCMARGLPYTLHKMGRRQRTSENRSTHKGPKRDIR